jgi:hypothetical protein
VPEPLVRVYDVKTASLVTIPLSDLPPGLVRATVEWVEGEFWLDPALLPAGVVRHPPFPPEIKDILVRLQAVFQDIFPRTLAEWEHGFRCDREPEREIVLWLRMAEAFEHFTAGRDLDAEQRRDLFAVIFNWANRTADGLRFVLPSPDTLTAEQTGEVIRWLEERQKGERQA